MNIEALKALQAKATPGKLRIRKHPRFCVDGFVEADTYEGHAYHGVASGFELLSAEDYPTKVADMELIVALWNALLEEQPSLAEKYRKLTEAK